MVEDFQTVTMKMFARSVSDPKDWAYLINSNIEIEVLCFRT
jgi:hypothetical protein